MEKMCSKHSLDYLVEETMGGGGGPRFYQVQVEEEHQDKAIHDLKPGQVWGGFKAVTSAHGIPHVNNARGVYKTTMWLLASLTCVGLLAYLAMGLFEKYYDFDVNVSVEVVHRTQLNFPAVTVCNQNPVRQSLADKNAKLSTVLSDTSKKRRRRRGAGAGDSGTAPSGDSGTAPSDDSGTAPSDDSGTAPSGDSGTAGSDDSGTAPSGDSGTALSGDSGTAGSDDSGTEPSGDSGTAGSDDSGTAPSGDSGTAPSGDSGTAPSDDSGTAPSGDSESAPSDDSGTAPSGDSGSATSGDSADPGIASPGDSGPEDSGTDLSLVSGDGLAGDAEGTGDDSGDSGDTYGVSGDSRMLESKTMPSKGGRAPRADYETRMKFLKVISEMTLDEKEPLGHQFEDFVLDCDYSGYTCLESDFSSFYNNIYGNCFTFNSRWNKSLDMQKSFRPGPNYGLSLTFNIDQDDYTGDLAQTAGVRVVVHAQDRMPFPEDEGISVSPGKISFVGLRKLTIEREGGKYGNCTEIDYANYSRNVFEERHPVNYSSTACYKTCYQSYIMRDCGCADSQYPMYGEAFAEFGNGNENYTLGPCDVTNATDAACMDDVTERYQNDELECHCPQACLEESYSTTVSSSLWPSEKYKHTLFEALASENEKIRHVLNSREDPEKYAKNLVKIIVYFEEFNFELIKESPLYRGINFVSDIGGILGLFLGFSVLTCLEFFELGLDFVILGLAKLCSCNKNKTHDEQAGTDKARLKGSTASMGSAVTTSDIPMKTSATSHKPPEDDLYPVQTPPPHYYFTSTRNTISPVAN